jgi:iron(III) transport system substrate-binding protein
MTRRRPTRREVIGGSAALGLSLFAAPLKAAAPDPAAITPQLIEAAKNDGKIVLYSAMDLPVGEKLGKAFEAQYPGVQVQIERTGSERLFQRIEQEFGSNVHAVDVATTADASHFISWKRNGWLAPFVPEDVAKYFPAQYRDGDGMFATSRLWLSSIAYNTGLVKPADAPMSFADLLDPKWAGKIVKAHPGFSGTIMTATYEMSRDLGWDYFEKLARQRVMQVQAAADPPKKVALGERAIMADGNDYVLILVKESGGPVEVVYPAEGAPLVVGPNAVFKAAPNPNAARLFQCFCFTAECQQLVSDISGMHSLHPDVKEKPGRRPLRDIKVMKEDAAAVEKNAEEIKARYTKIFRV